jgi:2-desacetyl-2-hydroxyethyl bacteriochlorophyllide A dehydrogenase
MRQIVLQEPGAFVARDVPEPIPGPDEALVRVCRIGVCGTDLHAFAGRQPFFSYPRVLGHELGVEIVGVPAGEHGLRPGDRCAVEPYLNCGTCHACRLGRPNCCERLQVLGVHTDGGMGEWLAVPVRFLHRSRQLTLDQLALVETLGIGFHAVERSGLQPGESVLVLGAGPIGLAVTQFAVAGSGKVTVADPAEPRRRFAERFGVEAVASAGDRLFEVVFDATGNVEAMQASFQRVAHGGRLVFVGLVLGSISFDDPLFHRREMTLLASRNSAGAFPKIIHLIERGELDTTPWITHRLTLDEVPSRFAGLRGEPGLVKAIIGT